MPCDPIPEQKCEKVYEDKCSVSYETEYEEVCKQEDVQVDQQHIIIESGIRAHHRQLIYSIL